MILMVCTHNSALASTKRSICGDEDHDVLQEFKMYALDVLDELNNQKWEILTSVKRSIKLLFPNP